MDKLRQVRELAGTEVKFCVRIEAPGLTMDDFDFECLFYPALGKVENPRRGVLIPKSAMVREDGGTFIAVVDTGRLGPGEIMCRTTAFLPDGHCDDGVRTEIVAQSTGQVMH